MGVSTNYSAWFGGGTNASTAVLTPQQVAAVAPLVRVTAAYVVMYYAFCFFQSWSKLYLSASRRPSHFSSYVDSCSCASSLCDFVRRRVVVRRASRRWRAEFGIARSGLLRHHIFESPPYAIAATHVRHRTGGGQRPRTPTARGRRSCS